MAAARLGPELEVSAWPEPPSVTPAEWCAGATAGATATERKRHFLPIFGASLQAVPPAGLPGEVFVRRHRGEKLVAGNQSGREAIASADG
jgi:hypothetical protein